MRAPGVRAWRSLYVTVLCLCASSTLLAGGNAVSTIVTSDAVIVINVPI